jgi:hypothetical protein
MGANQPVTNQATCVRFPPRLCENAAADFGERKSFYPRVSDWAESDFQLEKSEVRAQVASDQRNQFSASVTIGCFHTASTHCGHSHQTCARANPVAIRASSARAKFLQFESLSAALTDGVFSDDCRLISARLVTAFASRRRNRPASASRPSGSGHGLHASAPAAWHLRVRRRASVLFRSVVRRR